MEPLIVIVLVPEKPVGEVLALDGTLEMLAIVSRHVAALEDQSGRVFGVNPDLVAPHDSPSDGYVLPADDDTASEESVRGSVLGRTDQGHSAQVQRYAIAFDDERAFTIWVRELINARRDARSPGYAGARLLQTQLLDAMKGQSAGKNCEKRGDSDRRLQTHGISSPQQGRDMPL
jgi:hypothetical protein